jgi:hypothetical protein
LKEGVERGAYDRAAREPIVASEVEQRENPPLPLGQAPLGTPVGIAASASEFSLK